MSDYSPEAHPRPVGRLLPLAEVERETSLDHATIYRRIKAGTFPDRIRISTNRVAWSETDIEAWKQQARAAPA